MKSKIKHNHHHPAAAAGPAPPPLRLPLPQALLQHREPEILLRVLQGQVGLGPHQVPARHALVEGDGRARGGGAQVDDVAPRPFDVVVQRDGQRLGVDEHQLARASFLQGQAPPGPVVPELQGLGGATPACDGRRRVFPGVWWCEPMNWGGGGGVNSSPHLYCMLSITLCPACGSWPSSALDAGGSNVPNRARGRRRLEYVTQSTRHPRPGTASARSPRRRHRHHHHHQSAARGRAGAGPGTAR